MTEDLTAAMALTDIRIKSISYKSRALLMYLTWWRCRKGVKEVPHLRHSSIGCLIRVVLALVGMRMELLGS